ncbi:MAG: hypothetical protein HFI43_00385, partial [Lachnospiraceae bacterium]|nr:hypothetical protein [Lachnospiraceae bacterium]
LDKVAPDKELRHDLPAPYGVNRKTVTGEGRQQAASGAGFPWQEALRGAIMILLPGEGSRNSTPEDGQGKGSAPCYGLWRGLAIPPCIFPASRGLGK